MTGDPLETGYLFQRLSVAIQRGNEITVVGTMWHCIIIIIIIIIIIQQSSPDMGNFMTSYHYYCTISDRVPTTEISLPLWIATESHDNNMIMIIILLKFF